MKSITLGPPCLSEFTRDQSQDAFTVLVRRHLDLVYCAALRQVRSPQLAEEVSQSVFTELARNAVRLKADTILTAWLYQVTRRTAINVVRGEARRQLREQIATDMNTMNATAADWTHIEPLLDEAMNALDETDRAAVLLRFFENKSLREVGQTLGTSDDAAQKRVSRAVTRLREFLAKRGITIGTSGLVVVITASAVKAAPVGLATAISTAAALGGTTIVASTTIAAVETIAMTTLQKTLATIAVAALIAASLKPRIGGQTANAPNQGLPTDTGMITRTPQESVKTEPLELDQLRRDAREVHRLRAEVTAAHRQIAALSELHKGIEEESGVQPSVQTPNTSAGSSDDGSSIQFAGGIKPVLTPRDEGRKAQQNRRPNSGGPRARRFGPQ